MVDVGGTTTDIGAVTGGTVRIDRRGLIGGVPSSLPLAAIASHGVGGSSVIRVTDGRITVGPDSVGAAPGPACFSLGGTAATITDVYLLMGILDPATYLGGDLKFDTDRSAKAVTATIAEPLHVTLPEALALMEEAYVHSTAQAPLADGPLPDDTVLAAFGEARPMTICGTAPPAMPSSSGPPAGAARCARSARPPKTAAPCTCMSTTACCAPPARTGPLTRDCARTT